MTLSAAAGEYASRALVVMPTNKRKTFTNLEWSITAAFRTGQPLPKITGINTCFCKSGNKAPDIEGGWHFLNCTKLNRANKAHADAEYYIAHSLRALGLKATVEPMVSPEGRIRADVAIHDVGEDGHKVLIDFSSVNPMSRSYQAKEFSNYYSKVGEEVSTQHSSASTLSEGAQTPSATPLSENGVATYQTQFSAATTVSEEEGRGEEGADEEQGAESQSHRGEDDGEREKGGEKEEERSGSSDSSGALGSQNSQREGEENPSWTRVRSAAIFNREAEKNKKYKEACARKGNEFYPFVLSTFGEWGKETSQFYRVVEKEVAGSSHINFRKWKANFIAEVGCTFLKAVARACIKGIEKTRGIQTMLREDDEGCPTDFLSCDSQFSTSSWGVSEGSSQEIGVVV